jgi:hypothetical protein
MKTLKFQEKRAKIVNISGKKIVLRNVGNFEVHMLLKKHMSADDIFLAEASAIADRRNSRKLPYVL